MATMVNNSQKRPANSQRDPEWTKGRLLDAARDEFADKGLSGARVNTIAAEAGVNKQLLYYYFGDKDGLYSEVLKRSHAEIRTGEQKLKLESFPPEEAMTRFIEFSFDHMVAHQHFVALLGDENTHKARHVKQSGQLIGMHERLEKTIGGMLSRGRESGIFKRDVDPVELYISIASLCFFYHSNKHTLSTIFDRDVTGDEEIARRRTHVVDILMSYLKSDPV